MSSIFLRFMGPATAVLAVSACAQLPPDYSPHYVQVPVVSSDRPHRVVRYDVVPEACLVADPTDTQLGPRLPPGCANNANLVGMVEDKRDLVRGRKLGPAPASPSARAAQKYIYGSPSRPQGAGVDVSTQTTGGSGGPSGPSETVPTTPASQTRSH